MISCYDPYNDEKFAKRMSGYFEKKHPKKTGNPKIDDANDILFAEGFADWGWDRSRWILLDKNGDVKIGSELKKFETSPEFQKYIRNFPRNSPTHRATFTESAKSHLNSNTLFT